MKKLTKRKRRAKVSWYLLNNRLLEAKIGEVEARTAEIRARLSNGNKSDVIDPNKVAHTKHSLTGE